MSMKRWAMGGTAALLGGLGLVAASPKSPVGYVFRSAVYQLELLAGRVPIEEAIATHDYTHEQRIALESIGVIKSFGQSIGLKNTESYGTINPDWDRTIYNLSACDATAFRPATWWFPVVGTVPYLGFFDQTSAVTRGRELKGRGLDVYIRTAGAYSTLGWFRDPVLPGMLDWSEYQLSNTILHELAHSTLWIPGSVQFNESFANFVGDVASMQYMVHTYGEDGQPVQDTRHLLEDRVRWRSVLQNLYTELEGVYSEEGLSRADKVNRKHAIFAALPTRVAGMPFHRVDLYVASARRGPWNNARLMQFRTYNRSRDWFQLLLDEQQGDLVAFIHRLDEVTRGAEDPYAALALAVGESPPEP